MFVEEAIEANKFDIQLSLRFLKSVSINLIERLFLYHASSVVGYEKYHSRFTLVILSSIQLTYMYKPWFLLDNSRRRLMLFSKKKTAIHLVQSIFEL